MDALVNNVARKVAEERENLGDGRLERQSANADAVLLAAARDEMLRKDHPRQRRRRKLRDQRRYDVLDDVLAVDGRCPRVHASIEHLETCTGSCRLHLEYCVSVENEIL